MSCTAREVREIARIAYRIRPEVVRPDGVTHDTLDGTATNPGPDSIAEDTAETRRNGGGEPWRAGDPWLGNGADAVTAEPADLVDELDNEIATLSAHIHAATHRLLVLIVRFDRLRGWEMAGYSNCARWLATRTGIDLGAAREKVRAARSLDNLPLTSRAMARGELSFSQVRALSRVADRGNEPQLLELARGTTTAQLERIVRAWKRGSRKDEAEWERERHSARTFSVFPDDGGMYIVTGRLTPEVGALLMRAVEAASDALYRERPVHAEVGDSERGAAQRRADAVAVLAERALAAGFGGSTGHAHGVAGGAAEAPISGTRAERYQVVLHVDPETLSAGGELGRAELEDGTAVSAETARRISCDASVVRVAHAKDGSVLDVGRKTRTISPALRRALDVRDRGCRFPGCHLRFTDAHHVKHWADGGQTRLSNCLLLCKYHHALVHERGWRVEWWGKGRPVFYDPRGNAHFEGSWKPPTLSDRPVAELIAANERRGVQPDAWTPGARWEREGDIPAGVYFRAVEAM